VLPGWIQRRVRRDPIGYSVDNLLRIDDGALAGKSAATDTSRQEISRILIADAANGSLSGDDRAFVARAVATRAGLAPADAEKRSTRFRSSEGAVDKTRDANETARKVGLILALSLAPNAERSAMASRKRREEMQASHSAMPGRRKRRVRKSRAFC